MNNIENKRKGFSLVEICIVCGMILVCIVPVFSIMSQSSSGTIRSKNEILAQQHALNIISYCNAIDFDDEFLAPTNEREVENIKFENNEIIDINMEEDFFERTISVKKFSQRESPYKKYKLITVRVKWLQPGEKEQRKVVITGLVTE